MNINYNEQLTGRTAEFYKSFSYFSAKPTLFSGIRFFMSKTINSFYWKKHWADIGSSLEPWEIGQILGGN